ncbi:hypothetical protein [Acanthopleuribacter pedis]|uniref:Uncharacterized protein n=1 Tax=Acanthopleuribacter pedis TaxID=442870 RepID=A0A8J7QEJ6_9BACT|nr:hypothetical protein [Acanthopleuribacter pedis]MBO1318260.1 hypothetical protein [Acanthopleuribacter pedis]
MTYYRMRDIATPPFAYVLNKEEVIRTCSSCKMPFQDLEQELKVEICTTESISWDERILGKPMMADHWLIGDETFCGAIEEIAADQFDVTPITVVSWLTRTPLSMMTDPGSLLKERRHPSPPTYFYLRPRQQISLDNKLLKTFPPIQCAECRREIPEIPFDFQPIPDPGETCYPIASLRDLYLEGFDYLFHETIVEAVERVFPEMMLERLISEPLPI